VLLIKKDNIKRVILYGGIFILLFCLINFYWLVPYLNSIFQSGGIGEKINNKEFVNTSIQTMQGVTKSNNLIYPIYNLFHKQIQLDFNWNMKEIFLSWYEKFLPINLIFIFIIFSALLFKKESKYKEIIFLAFIIFLINLYLYTIKIGNIGTNIFSFLISEIPGMVMFRNNFDKFGLSYAFSYSILIYYGLLNIFSKIGHKKIGKISVVKVISIIVITIIIIENGPFLIGKFQNLTLWTTQDTYTNIKEFNTDFISLNQYLMNEDFESGSILWLPFTVSGYLPIQDKSLENHYYNGLSPIRIISGEQDYAGILNFPEKEGETIYKSIKENDFKTLDYYIKKYNVKYIGINKNLNEELKKSYHFTGDDELVNKELNESFLENIVGEKLMDFGDRYSIYYTKQTSLPTVYSKNIKFQKIYSTKYNLYIKEISKPQQLSFLESYHNDWKLYLKKNPSSSWCKPLGIYNITKTTECEHTQKFFEGEELSYLYKKPIFDNTHEMVLDYANSWTIDPQYIKDNYSKDYYTENQDGSINIEMVMYFKPQSYFYLGIIISATTLFICIIYLIISGIKNRGSKRIEVY
jgi:hypothetical protein